MILSDRELAVLKAIDRSEFGKYLNSPTWVYSIVSFPKRGGYSFAGTISALVSYGLVCTGKIPDAKGRKTPAIWMTPEGIQVYINTVGINNVRKSFEPQGLAS